MRLHWRFVSRDRVSDVPAGVVLHELPSGEALMPPGGALHFAGPAAGGSGSASSSVPQTSGEPAWPLAQADTAPAKERPQLDSDEAQAGAPGPAVHVANWAPAPSQNLHQGERDDLSQALDNMLAAPTPASVGFSQFEAEDGTQSPPKRLRVNTDIFDSFRAYHSDTANLVHLQASDSGPQSGGQPLPADNTQLPAYVSGLHTHIADKIAGVDHAGQVLSAFVK